MSEEYRELFFQEMDKDYALMLDFLRDSEWPDLALVAHRIRGRAKIMGFDEFDGICTALENSALREDSSSGLKAMEALQVALSARR